MFVSDKFPTYELDQSRVDPAYLKWYFQTPELANEAQSLSTGSATISKLTLNPPKFLELTLPFPALSEQQRIVAKIDRLAERIEEAWRLRHHSAQELEAFSHSHMRRVFADIRS